MILLFRLIVVLHLFVLIWNGNYDRISRTEFPVQYNTTRLRQFYKGHYSSEGCRDELPKSYDIKNLNQAY